MFITGLILGLVLGVIATILVFRRNKGIQAKAEALVDDVKARANKG